MDEVKHTPGPWRVEADTTLVWGACNPDDQSSWGMGYPVAAARVSSSGGHLFPTLDEGVANAWLISAAPEMLEALKALQHEFDQLYDGPEHPLNCIAEQMQQVRAAIAKAEGRAT